MTQPVQIAVDQGSVQTLLGNVLELDKKVRRRVLERVGRAVVKIQKPVMKKLAGARSKTGALAKSIDGKVSVNKARTRVTAIVGPSRGKTKGGKLRRRTFAVTRRTRAGLVPVLNRKGQQLVRQPTRYAHLAGPKRKSSFVQQTAQATKSAVAAKMAGVLTDTIAGN
jgi:hypothetical protein